MGIWDLQCSLKSLHEVCLTLALDPCHKKIELELECSVTLTYYDLSSLLDYEYATIPHSVVDLDA